MSCSLFLIYIVIIYFLGHCHDFLVCTTHSQSCRAPLNISLYVFLLSSFHFLKLFISHFLNISSHRMQSLTSVLYLKLHFPSLLILYDSSQHHSLHSSLNFALFQVLFLRLPKYTLQIFAAVHFYSWTINSLKV